MTFFTPIVSPAREQRAARSRERSMLDIVYPRLKRYFSFVRLSAMPAPVSPFRAIFRCRQHYSFRAFIAEFHRLRHFFFTDFFAFFAFPISFRKRYFAAQRPRLSPSFSSFRCISLHASAFHFLDSAISFAVLCYARERCRQVRRGTRAAAARRRAEVP